MEKKEFTEQVMKLISDQEYKRLRLRFQDIDVPFSWCSTKEAVCQLYIAIDKHRSRHDDDDYTFKKSTKSKKKGLFGLFR